MSHIKQTEKKMSRNYFQGNALHLAYFKIAENLDLFQYARSDKE